MRRRDVSVSKLHEHDIMVMSESTTDLLLLSTWSMVGSGNDEVEE